MWKDPIVEETRQAREAYAASLNHDLGKIFEDVRRRQLESEKQVVSLPPRKPRKRPKAA